MSAFTEAWLVEYQAKREGQKGAVQRPAPDLIEFSIPVALNLLNVTNGQHWATCYAYRRRLVPVMAEALKPWIGCVPMVKARVDVVRYSVAVADWDNVVGSAKPLIDLLVSKSKTHPHSFGIIFDDSPQDIELSVRGEKVMHRDDVRTTVRIERLL